LGQSPCLAVDAMVHATRSTTPRAHCLSAGVSTPLRGRLINVEGLDSINRSAEVDVS